ncbi:MAG: amidohydrolase family protein [Terriglobia bacterium]|jgi:predicted TIM-barrel fold metal-dependent hydrolase
MIVDCHTHIWQYPGHLSDEFVQEANQIARGHPIDLNVTPEKHWEAMKGVDRVIVFGMRAQHSGILTPNKYLADYANRFPEKVIGFGGVDPLVDDVVTTLEELVRLKLRGVKLGPIYQNIHPLDARMLKVYEFCERSGLPIMIHQGATFPRKAPLKYALPILLEDVALQFPALKMVIAHLGHPWIDDTLVLIRKQPNLYADISALHYRPWQFYQALITAKEYGVLHKLLLGSDYPFTTPEATIDALRNFNKLVEGTNLPRLGAAEIESLIYSPTLTCLGLQ